MLLTFKTMDDLIFKLEVDSSEKIKELKKQIEREKGTEYKPERMKLLFAGKILDDEKEVADYKINEASYIIISVPKAKMPSKGSDKKSNLHKRTFQGIETIQENEPILLDQMQDFSVLPSSNFAIPLGYHPDTRRERPLSRGESSENEHSVESKRNSFQSRTLSSNSGSSRKGQGRCSVKSATSAVSGQRPSVIREISSSSRFSSAVAANSNAPLFPTPAETTGMPDSSLSDDNSFCDNPDVLDEHSKHAEVSNWLEKLEVEPQLTSPEQPPLLSETYTKKVQDIMAMGFEEKKAEAALNASFNNVEEAVDYLLAEHSPAEEPEIRTPQFALMPPVLPPRLPRNYSRADDLDDLLQFLQNDDEFQTLKILCQAHPDTLSGALESYKTSHSDLAPVFEAYEDRLVELLTEPMDTSHFRPGPAAIDTSYPAVTVMDTSNSNTSSSETPEPPVECKTNVVALPEGMECVLGQQLTQFHELGSQSLTIESTVLKSLLPHLNSEKPLDLTEEFCDRLPDSTGVSLEQHHTPPIHADAERFDDSSQDVSFVEDDEPSKELIKALLAADAEEEAERERVRLERELSSADSISLRSETAAFENSDLGSRAGDDLNRIGRRTLEDHGYVRVTMEEKEAIDRLKTLGFSEEQCVQIYLACEKNEELAANILLERD